MSRGGRRHISDALRRVLSSSPCGEQPKHRELAHELQQPTAGYIAIFHKYCCYTKRGGITTKLTLRNHWGYITNVSKYHNVGIWSMD